MEAYNTYSATIHRCTTLLCVTDRGGVQPMAIG